MLCNAVVLCYAMQCYAMLLCCAMYCSVIPNMYCVRCVVICCVPCVRACVRACVPGAGGVRGRRRHHQRGGQRFDGADRLAAGPRPAHRSHTRRRDLPSPLRLRTSPLSSFLCLALLLPLSLHLSLSLSLISPLSSSFSVSLEPTAWRGNSGSAPMVTPSHADCKLSPAADNGVLLPIW